jgi:predicted RNase H-like nuclease
LKFEKYEQANLWGKQNGAGVSRQLFSLVPKIAQVDHFIDAQQQATLRETHPELVFLRLNRGCSLPSKKSREGIEVRRRLIRHEGISGVDDWINRRRLGTGAKADDVLDACAAAVAARDLLHHLPNGEPEVDARGLKMEIWY